MKSAFFCSAIALVGACSGEDEELSSISEQGVLAVPVQHTSDEANPPGTKDFYWLTPMVATNPTFSAGTFNSTFKARLKVSVTDLDCVTGAEGAQKFQSAGMLMYTATSTYKVASNVNTMGLVSGNCYRVAPLLDNASLGFRDVHVTSGTATPGFLKWVPGQNVTIAFRIQNNLDTDADTILNHVDNCPEVANTDQADGNANDVGDACDVVDGDNDGHPDSSDNCPTVANVDQADADGDLVGDACDLCSADPAKVAPGTCGCSVSDADSDGDGTADCNDGCPVNEPKTAPGVCGCATADVDSDSDGTFDCLDSCPADAPKTAPGLCGCSQLDVDYTGDGVVDGCAASCVAAP